MGKLNIIIAVLLFCSVQSIAQPKNTRNVLTQADIMPALKMCIEDRAPDICTKEKITAFINENLRYPQKAIQEKVEGVVVVSFVVRWDGSVVDHKVENDLGAGCGDEALRLVRKMPPWSAGYNGEEPVSVSYTIQVPFSLKSEMPKTAQQAGTTDPFGNIISAKKDTLELPDKTDASSSIASDKPGVFKKVEQMPYFAGCGMHPNKSREKRSCSNDRLGEFIRNNVAYPESAQTKDIQGVVYVKFTVDEFGRMLDPEVTRDIGGGCAEEAQRVIELMPLWEPGRQDGKPVKVELRLPVRFYLNDGNEQTLWLSWGNQRGETITEDGLEKLMDDNILVWDQYGNEKHVNALTFLYVKGSRTNEAASTGRINKKIQKLLKKAKKGGEITVLALVQENGELIEVEKRYKVVR